MVGRVLSGYRKIFTQISKMCRNKELSSKKNTLFALKTEVWSRVHMDYAHIHGMELFLILEDSFWYGTILIFSRF